MKKEFVITALIAFGLGFLAGYIYNAQQSWKAQQHALAARGQMTSEGGGHATGSAGMAGLPEGHPPVDPARLIKNLEQQAEKNPRDPEPAIRLGNLFYDQGHYVQAADWYERALEIDPTNVNCRTDLGTAFFYLGRPKDALREYERALAIQPKHEPAIFNKIIVNLEGTRDIQAARTAWELLFKLNPDYPGLVPLKQQLQSAAAGGAAGAAAR